MVQVATGRPLLFLGKAPFNSVWLTVLFARVSLLYFQLNGFLFLPIGVSNWPGESRILFQTEPIIHFQCAHDWLPNLEIMVTFGHTLDIEQCRHRQGGKCHRSWLVCDGTHFLVLYLSWSPRTVSLQAFGFNMTRTLSKNGRKALFTVYLSIFFLIRLLELDVLSSGKGSLKI